MDLKSQVRQFILRNYLFTSDEGALQDAVSLMKAGVVDSTGVLELIAFLEEGNDAGKPRLRRSHRRVRFGQALTSLRAWSFFRGH
jgi:hypothetical protein